MLERVAGYPGLFLMCASSGVLLPVPEDIALLYAGSRLETGEMQWGPALFAAILGVFSRDLFAYGVGHLVGEWLLARPAVVRMFGRKKLDRARALVGRRGASAVFAGRFLVGLRAPVFLMAGAMGVPFRKFLVWNTLGMLVAVPGVMVLGFVFGPPLAEGAFFVVRHLRGALLIGGAVVLVAVWLWWRLRADPGPAIDEGDDVALQPGGSDQTGGC